MVNGSAISKGSTSGGSGVGIYAVKRMLDRLGGGIEAQGIAGQFIEITIEIPCYEINEKVTHIVSFENTEISVEN
jgi:sensor histidine kinase regulating citrate/malate metabolism